MSVANYFRSSALIKSACCIGVISITFALYVGGSGRWLGALGLGITPNTCRMMNVFRAAPLSWSVCFVMEQFTHRNAPPAYVSVVAPMVHVSQFIPSSGWMAPRKVLARKSGPIAGMVGSLFPRDKACCACTKVDVWMNGISNIEQAPTINDANASITLDIKPPLNGERGDCAVWVYHYGNPPAKFMPIAPQLELIGGGRASTVSQSSMPSIPEAP